MKKAGKRSSSEWVAYITFLLPFIIVFVVAGCLFNLPDAHLARKPITYLCEALVDAFLGVMALNMAYAYKDENKNTRNMLVIFGIWFLAHAIQAVTTKTVIFHLVR